MFIKELSVKSYKNLDSLDLKFSRSEIQYFNQMNLSIFVGENGVGKSSVLQLMAQIFCPSGRYQYKHNIESTEFSIKYELTDKQIDYNHNAIYPSDFPEKLIVSSYAVFDQFASRYPSSDFGKVTLSENEVNETSYVYCGPAIARTSTLEPLIYAFLQAVYMPEKMTRNIDSYNKLLNKIGFKKIAFIEMAQDNKNVEREFRKTYGVVDDAYLPDIDFLIDRLNKARMEGRKLAREVHFTLLKGSPNSIVTPDILENCLGEMFKRTVKEEIYIGIKNIWLENSEGQYVRLSELSSGELSMLYRFLPLITNIVDNSLVFIDEPETHLHPIWLQEFVEYLNELFNDYKSHFILATHSPLIVSDVPMECIIGLQKVNNEISQYMPKDRTLGGSSNDILRNVFSLKTTIGKFSNKQIIEMEKLFDSGKSKEIEEAQIIFDDLSTTPRKFEIYKKYKDFLGD